MSYDVAKKDFLKEKFWIIEMDLDYCNLDYGSGACTASVGVTGAQKCFNTAKTCQDRVNYDKGTKTYRYCTKRSPLPEGLNAIPSLKAAPSISGAQINAAGGLGVRGSISLSFLDHQSNDVGIDKYTSERAYIPYDTGTYWGKLRARNPYYNNREIRAYSGYLVDGEYDPANFQQRTYVIENITSNRGVASVTGKDVLKLADNDRSQYPLKSNGSLSADITSAETSITLTPAGIGDLEYDASGWLRLSNEVVSFTRVADVLTIVRGQYNTSAVSHSLGDTAQQCKYFNDSVDNIVYELLTVGAKIAPSFINLPTWELEVGDNFPYLLEALITEPVGVQKLLKELGDNAPHFLYFDERAQLINLTAVKQPPINVNIVNNNEHILKDSLTVADMPDSRLSDVFVYFGQKDPTKKMDEVNNYAQTYIRSDLASSGEDEYGSKKIETIYSRWISNVNLAAAIDMTTRKGRRFGITPRKVSFKMTAKDSDFWLGDELGIDHPAIQTETGETGSNIFQIISVKEAGDFSYTALEYLYSAALPDEPDTGVTIIPIGGDEYNLNLRAVYDAIIATPPTATSNVKFIIYTNVKIGSTDTVNPSLDTGAWPTGATLTLQTNSGAFVVGKGGDGSYDDDGLNGGNAINLSYPLTIINDGVIGGGGGGGGSEDQDNLGGDIGGGGGAGYDPGDGYRSGEDGTLEFGGAGGEPFNSGAGGDLGDNGETAGGDGGLAGAAIKLNGFTLTQTVSGDIRGAIIA